MVGAVTIGPDQALIFITILTAAILAPIVIVTGFFALELLAGLAPLEQFRGNGGAIRALIVIPAHDEQAVIGQTVANLKEFGVLVVADNCADETAEVARAAGAEVVVRNDPERRGKGFALVAARDQLRGDPPEVVIVVDADCSINGASSRALAKSASSTGRPCQAVNLLAPDLTGAAMVQISTFAFMIKNLVRQRGLQRLAGRAHLTGTGMALPWRIFEGANLGGSNIVEDLALGLELAERSAPAMLVEGATIWSPPASAAGTLVQRRRWEGGYIATALKAAPKALMRSVARGDLRGIFAALDLSVPPLTLLFALNALAFLIALLAAMIGAAIWPLLTQLAVGAIVATALAMAWAREGRRFVSGLTLLRLPVYVLWKAPMYLGLARRGAPEEWLRTGRN
jgi:cellulose synthase/poly-beta-1,6-N-acetylglucosamine synthase-like glycosyltransferase